MRRLVFCTLLTSLLSCTGHHTSPPPQLAFYHWKNTFSPTLFERDILDSLSCNTLFVKVLDIGKDVRDGSPVPYARTLIKDSTALRGRQIIQCCFITNEVFAGMDEERTGLLARRLSEPSLWPLWDHPGATEIQFDCDWTASTRDAFFGFLNQMHSLLPSKFRISATIRLHQYKFPQKTGVPPVERGTLMLYNTGDIEQQQTNNSIFDVRDAQRYLKGAPDSYPLPLDVALPIFSWGLVYREGQFWKIINGLQERVLADTVRFNKYADHQWLVRKETFEEGHFLRPDDVIRLEQISPATLKEAARLARTCPLAPDARLALFHLDSALLRLYDVRFLNSLVSDSISH
jgi:hypothetical protein